MYVCRNIREGSSKFGKGVYKKECTSFFVTYDMKELLPHKSIIFSLIMTGSLQSN